MTFSHPLGSFWIQKLGCERAWTEGQTARACKWQGWYSWGELKAVVSSSLANTQRVSFFALLIMAKL